MPIDPSIIPNTLKGFNTPFERLDKMVSAQQTQSVNAARDAQTNKLRQEQAEQEALRRMLAETGGDLSDETLNRMVAIAPITGTKLAGDIIKQRKEMLDATKVELDTEWQQTTRGIQLLQAAQQNPTLYTQVRAQAIAKGGDLADLLRQHPTYDPAVVESLLHSGITTEKYLEINRKLMEDFAKGEFRHFAGAANFVKDDPKELEELVNAARMAGMPKALIDATLANPEALSQTETERQTQAGQAEGREIQRTGQQITLRGQDIAAQTARRGQDMSAETARRGQNMTDARARAEASGGGKGTPEQAQLVEAVMANPALYADLTPSVKSAIAGELSKRGFKFSAAVTTKGGPNVVAIMNEIGDLSKRINTSNSGPLTTLSGFMRKGAASVNLDNDVAEYEALVRGMIPMVARANGHTGVLTQQDVDSTRELFPQVGDNATLAKNKLERVNKLIAGGPGQTGQTTQQTPNQTPIGGASVIEVKAPNGKTYTFPNQQQADQFKRRAGIR